MNNFNIFVIFSLVICAVRCDDSHEKDGKDESSGLNLGVIAAIAIGGAVGLALVIIVIVKIILVCKKKAKPAIQPTQGVSTVTPTEKMSNATPLYDEPPPMYSLRDEGPSHDVYLPPYSSKHPTKQVV